MKKQPSSGRFIVIEGLDGSGKATQTKLLYSRFKKEGGKVAKIDFPQYGTKSAGLVEEYLNGKYGSSEEVGPYRASIFYACDRYDSSFKLRKWIEEGKIIISDRYISSNIGHQGGKIENKKERKKYIKWLYDLEYNIFKIPKPDITFILKTSPSFSMKFSSKIIEKEKKKKRESYLGNKKRDIHEADKIHLTNTLSSYIWASKEFPKDFRVIECIENGQLLSIKEVHQKIWNIIKREGF